MITAAFAHARDRSGCRICFGEVENSRTSCLEGKSGCGQTFRDGPRPPADSHAPGACYRPGRGMCFHLNSRFELGAGCLVGGCLLLDLDSTLPGVTSVELTGTQEGFSRGGDLRGLAKNFPFSARLGLRPRLADASCGVSSARRGGRPEQGEAEKSASLATARPRTPAGREEKCSSCFRVSPCEVSLHLLYVSYGPPQKSNSCTHCEA